MALETLDRYAALELWTAAIEDLSNVAFLASYPRELEHSLRSLGAVDPSLLGGLQWLLADNMSYPARNHFLRWRTWSAPIFAVDADVVLSAVNQPDPEPSPTIKDLFADGTKSQRAAMKDLSYLIAVKRLGRTFGGITPRTTALLVGLSGSGKSWVAENVAAMAGIRSFGATVGSWLIYGGRGETPTAERIRRHLRQHGASIIVIDEIDKVRMGKDDGNAGYFRCIWDEVMSLLDGRADRWPDWSEKDVAALRASHFVTAGAFQDVYRKELGAGPVLLAEEIESLEPVTFERISSAEILPDELLNRLGSVIEIRPPETDEVAERMFEIETDAGFICDNQERVENARRIACSLTGMRGLEDYALQLAQRRIREDRRIAREKAQ
ncbi:MAG: AAA family ATPase [Chthoniobacterales bacterium]